MVRVVSITMLALSLLTSHVSAQSGPGSAGLGHGDFNNDGIADLAVGVPDEARQSTRFDPACSCLRNTTHAGAGAVNIVYGGASGLTPTGSQVLGQSTLAIAANAQFGKALAAGRFRGWSSGSDLAVGVPGSGTGGEVDVFFSDSSGRLNSTPNQRLFAQNISTAGTSFGLVATVGVLILPRDLTMVSGDFNGDGLSDLAVEVTRENGAHETNTSAVVVLYGSAGTGFTVSNSTLLVIDDALAPDPVSRPGCGVQRSACGEVEGHIGLAAADLDGDARDELLIGTPAFRELDDAGTTIRQSVGGIIIVPGEASGLPARGDWGVLLSNDPAGPTFGHALAVGDFDGNGESDVAIGDAAASVIANQFESGRVRIFTNVGAGGSPTSSIELRQSDAPNQQVEGGDRFGAALAAHDFNGDGVSDLAVGAPGESTQGTSGHGAVTTFYGQTGARPVAGLTLAPQGFLPAFGVVCCFNGAAFGSSLAASDFGATPQGDLAVGSPSFTPVNFANNTILSVIPAAGAIVTLYGQPNIGFLPSAFQLWTQNPGFRVCLTGFCFTTAGSARTGNHFGAAVD